MLLKFKADKEISNGPKRKKNRSKFCGGKLGKVHQPIWKVWEQQLSMYRRAPENAPLIYLCQNCGKHIDYWYITWWHDNYGYAKPEVGSVLPKQKKII